MKKSGLKQYWAEGFDLINWKPVKAIIWGFNEKDVVRQAIELFNIVPSVREM